MKERFHVGHKYFWYSLVYLQNLFTTRNMAGNELYILEDIMRHCA